MENKTEMVGKLEDEYILLPNKVEDKTKIPDMIILEQNKNVMFKWSKNCEKNLSKPKYFPRDEIPLKPSLSSSTHEFDCFEGKKLMFSEKTIERRKKDDIKMVWTLLEEVEEKVSEYKRYIDFMSEECNEEGIILAEKVPPIYNKFYSNNNEYSLNFASAIHGGVFNTKYYKITITTNSGKYCLQVYPIVKTSSLSIAKEELRKKCGADGEVRNFCVEHITDEFFGAAYWVFD